VSPWTKLGDRLPRRQATPDEMQYVADIIVMAHQWLRGEVTLQDIRDSSSGYHRWLAACCVILDVRDKEALMDLTKALADDDDLHSGKTININEGNPIQPPLYLSREELGRMGYQQMTNHQGRRVWVSPLFQMHGEWFYPPVHLPPGENRRQQEAAMNAQYNEYRAAKKKGRGRRDDA